MVEKLQRMFNDSHIICDMDCASPEKKKKKEAVEKLSLTAVVTDRLAESWTWVVVFSSLSSLVLATPGLSRWPAPSGVSLHRIWLRL